MPPVSCPDIDSASLELTSQSGKPTGQPINLKSLYNFPMSLLRWLFFVLSIAIGLGLGLYYGWVLSPVQFVDTTPSTLRTDFRADYTLMVAETFQHDQDIESAARHLAILGSQPPAQITSAALIFAQQYKFNRADITLLQNLSIALQVWQPGGVVPTVQPGGNQP